MKGRSLRQLRLRLRRTTPARSTEPLQAWAIVRSAPPLPFAVVFLADEFRPNLRAGVAYTQTLEAARRYVPDGCLAVTGFEAARLVKALPPSFGEVVEVWF
jgi:hypothetical protein